MIQAGAFIALTVTGAVIGVVISLRGWHPTAPERARPPAPASPPGGEAPVLPPTRCAPRPGSAPGPEQPPRHPPAPVPGPSREQP